MSTARCARASQLVPRNPSIPQTRRASVRRRMRAPLNPDCSGAAPADEVTTRAERTPAHRRCWSGTTASWATLLRSGERGVANFRELCRVIHTQLKNDASSTPRQREERGQVPQANLFAASCSGNKRETLSHI